MASQHFYMVTPGARLDIGPTGGLYETMGEDAAIAAKSNAEASAAAADPNGAAAARRALKRMKRSLKGYLAIRKKLTDLMSGKKKGKIPPGLARKLIDLDPVGEQKLANDLYVLLSEIHDPAILPAPGPDSVVALSQMAITGDASEAATPSAQGFIPILIMVGGVVLLLTLTSFISNRAEVQKKKLEIECEKAGECSRTSDTIVKVGAVMFAAWFAWEKMGVKQKFVSSPKARTKRRRR